MSNLRTTYESLLGLASDSAVSDRFRQLVAHRGALAHEKIGAWETAAEFWAKAGDNERAAALFKRAGRLERAARLLFDLGHYQAALQLYEKAAAEQEATGQNQSVAYLENLLMHFACLMHIGDDPAACSGLITKARQLLLEIGRGSEASHDAHIEADAWACWGRCGHLAGRFDFFHEGFERALRLLDVPRFQAAKVALLEQYGERATAWVEPLLQAEIAAALAPYRNGARLKWHADRDEIERHSFKNGKHDVLHFSSESQWAAWHCLSEIVEDDLVDVYMRSLAPDGMIYIPTGAFLMGFTDEETELALDDYHNAEEKNGGPDLTFFIESARSQSSLFLPGYYIDQCPVTNYQFRQFVEAGGYQTERWWTLTGWREKEKKSWEGTHNELEKELNWDDLPVVKVNWYEAIAYANWAGKMLPSEAHWEKAAGWDPDAGQMRRYPWGNIWEDHRCNVGKNRGISPTGAFSPEGDSYYGVQDMAGNVFEWCSTAWGEARDEATFRNPYQADDGRELLEADLPIRRVVRGSAYEKKGLGMIKELKLTASRCSFRLSHRSEVSTLISGFRCIIPHVFQTDPSP